MRKPVYILVNGILTFPGSAKAWTDRGVTALLADDRVDVVAEKFEYFGGALTRRFWQGRNADNLASLIRRYAGRKIHLVGHSNGCDLIARALAITATEIASIHLIAGAVDEDFDRNGINEDLVCAQLGKVFVYASSDDAVLRWLAVPSRALFGWAGLGYGALGLTGPEGVTESVGARVIVSTRPGFGHSTWFTAEHFAETLNAILRNDGHLSP